MILDLDKYRTINKPIIETWLKRCKDIDPMVLRSQISIGTECHIVAVCYYIGEIKGFTREILESITYLENFYQITEVKGKML